MNKSAAFSQSPKNPRMASFSALLDFEKRKRKIDTSLSDWLKQAQPTSLNYQLAQHIAYGVCKRKLTLDFYASQLDIKGSLKLREKTILRMALYQLLFMDKIPFYAIVDESVNLAKKVISQQTGSFFNALLRKLENKKFIEPNQKHLESLGYRVVMTRARDVFVPLSARVILANRRSSSIFISIHYNSALSPSAKGIEVYYYNKGTQVRKTSSQQLAGSVLSHMVRETKAGSRGTKEGNFHVIRETLMPAVLIEAGFITNGEERALIGTQSYLDKLAKGIARGVDKYVNSQT